MTVKRQTKRQVVNAALMALDGANRCAFCKIGLRKMDQIRNVDGTRFCSLWCRSDFALHREPVVRKA